MIGVLVDSSADLPPDVATAAGIQVDPIHGAVRTRIPVRVAEPKGVSYAYGMVALPAASAAARGVELEEVARSSAAVVGKSTTLIVVGTLEFLMRSRRIGRMQSWLATLLDLQPLQQSVDGVMTAAGPVRGRQRGRDLVASRASVCRTSAELRPVIACHTGPGAVGLVHGQV